ncbi:MAG TPA: MFS transporter, partial [Chthoniobacterales bacterium]|nr:MFS transporter [Chthoniobacterales bacterium]
LGGALIPLIGTNTIFAANGAAFLLINLALLRWRQPTGQPQFAVENVFKSFATAVRYVRYAPGMQVILVRQNILPYTRLGRLIEPSEIAGRSAS